MTSLLAIHRLQRCCMQDEAMIERDADPAQTRSLTTSSEAAYRQPPPLHREPAPHRRR